MKRKIEANGENKHNKKLKAKQNSFLDFFDTHILSQILFQLVGCVEKENKHFIKKRFEDCLCFSLISKIFNFVSKQLRFSVNIFKGEKIENINFNIYLKLNYMIKQTEVTDKILKLKEQLPNFTFKDATIKLKFKQKILNEILVCNCRYYGIYDIIPTLILSGADVEYEGYKKIDQGIALYQSCVRGNYKTSKILIQYNSNINYENLISETLLHASCASGNLKLVKYLINKGLNIHQESNHLNQTPLFDACNSENFNLVKYLIEEKNCDIHAKNLDNEGILVRPSGNIKILEYLIDLGLNINDQDDFGFTLLYHACVENNVKTLKFLISKGVDLSIKYNDEKTRKKQNIFEYLKFRESSKPILEVLRKYC